VWVVLVASVVGLATATPGPSNQVQGVKPFPLDQDSGSMALHALTSCLEAVGAAASYSRLISLSGSGFKFVYDTTEAYEPLRDLFPIDMLKMSAQAVGFPDAHWEMDQPMEAVKAMVRKEIDAGRSVVAPFLKDDAYHGFFVITGYDFERNVFKLQGAFSETSYTEVPIPASWSGPTASPMGWATNPVFVLGDNNPGSVGYDLDKRMMETGMALLTGGELAYGLTPGEQAYLGSPGPHMARYGIPAYQLLAADVAGRPLVVTREGREVLNFGFIWRLDAQLGQLQQDRGYAATSLSFLSSRVAGGKSLEVQAVAANVGEAADDAADLRKLFWDLVPRRVETARAVADYVRAGRSMIYSLAAREAVVDEVRGLGFKVFESPWGPAIVDDSPAKRLQARVLVKSLEVRDGHLLRGLGEIAGYVGPDLGVPEPESPKARRHKK
jgi:hypothetical protein